MIVREIKKVTFWGLLVVLAVSVFPSNSSAAATSSVASLGYALVGDDDDQGKDKQKDKHKDKGGHGRKGSDDDRGQRGGDRGSGGQHRGDDDDRGSRREQRWNDQNSRRAQWESDQGARQQQVWSDRRARRQQEWSDRGSRDQRWNDDRRSRRSDKDIYGARGRDNRQVYQVPQTWTQWFPNSEQYRNHGQRVSAERHRRNDERRRYKEERKQQKRYDRQQRGYGDGNYNYNGGNDNYDVYQPRRSSIKQQLLQTVVGGLLGGGQFGGLEQLFPNRGNTGIYQPNYNSSPRYAQPQYQGQQYNSPSYSPMYSDAYNDSGYSRSNSSGIGSILQVLPLAAIIQQYTGGNDFLSSIVSNSVLGNDSGFGDTGYNDVGYNDVGYDDQNYGGEVYDQQSNGTGDLISVLLSNVLSGV